MNRIRHRAKTIFLLGLVGTATVGAIGLAAAPAAFACNPAIASCQIPSCMLTDSGSYECTPTTTYAWVADKYYVSSLILSGGTFYARYDGKFDPSEGPALAQNLGYKTCVDLGYSPELDCVPY